jgi:hypothetical protein
MIINRQSKSLIAAIAVIFGGSLLFLAATTQITTTYGQSEVNQTSSGIALRAFLRLYHLYIK